MDNKGKQPAEEDAEFFSFLDEYLGNVGTASPLPSSPKTLGPIFEVRDDDLFGSSSSYSLDTNPSPRVFTSPENSQPVRHYEVDELLEQVMAESENQQGPPPATPPPAATPPPPPPPPPPTPSPPHPLFQPLFGPPFRQIKERVRKVMSPEDLAKLEIHDPKRAKRIVTNRMSAVKSKEKKKQRLSTLEEKLEIMRAEAKASFAEISAMEAEGQSLQTENQQMSNHLDLMKVHLRLQDALNGEITREIQHLAVLTGQRSNLVPPLAINTTAANATLSRQQFPGLQIPGLQVPLPGPDRPYQQQQQQQPQVQLAATEFQNQQALINQNQEQPPQQPLQQPHQETQVQQQEVQPDFFEHLEQLPSFQQLLMDEIEHDFLPSPYNNKDGFGPGN